jgi:hypothetical protein
MSNPPEAETEPPEKQDERTFALPESLARAVVQELRNSPTGVVPYRQREIILQQLYALEEV